MKNALKLFFSFLFLCTFMMHGQETVQLPEGTYPNEFNIVGAEYPRVGKDGRTYFKVYAPDANKVGLFGPHDRVGDLRKPILQIGITAANIDQPWS